jgi:hypothetical protein
MFRLFICVITPIIETTALKTTGVLFNEQSRLVSIKVCNQPALVKSKWSFVLN